MNEQFYILLSLLAFGWCILSVILFFKIWGMTNDVSEIKELLKGKLKQGGNEDAPKMEEVKCDVPEERQQAADEVDEDNDSSSLGLVPIFWGCIMLVVVILAVIFLNVK